MKTLYSRVSILSHNSWLDEGFAAIFISARTQVFARPMQFSEEPERETGSPQSWMRRKGHKRSHSGSPNAQGRICLCLMPERDYSYDHIGIYAHIIADISCLLNHVYIFCTMVLVLLTHTLGCLFKALMRDAFSGRLRRLQDRRPQLPFGGSGSQKTWAWESPLLMHLNGASPWFRLPKVVHLSIE